MHVLKPKGFSDHASALVSLSRQVQPSRKPFRFFHFLTDVPQFQPLVSQFWSSSTSLTHSRSAMHRLYQKLKQLKPLLRALNKNRYGDITKKAKEALEKLCTCQQALLHDPSEANFLAEQEAAKIWRHFANVEEKFFKQKSRVLWLGNGDMNTSFFDNSAKSKSSRNTILSLKLEDGSMIKDPKDIKQEAVRYFKEILSSPHPNERENVLDLTRIIRFRCTEDMITQLVSPITEEEIRQALFDMPLNKAPGPDGYTAEFFRSTWSVTGKDVVVAVQSFFNYGFLPSGVNATCLTLIPKKQNPETIKDFRPISCCNTLYKLISRLLAGRLQQILPMAIEQNQCAFIKGRLLLENVLLATELTKDYHKSNISARCALKLDISKAFDTISWSFILDVLEAMGFPLLFIYWIRMCITTAGFSISINGALEGFFLSSRGIRQGCSLPPYLFNLAINVLSILLNRGAEKGYIGYHPTCHETKLTHLSFADDLLVFFDGSIKSLKGIMDILDIFGNSSGLHINYAKSTVFTAEQINQEFHDLIYELDIPSGTLPIRYLGLPLTTKNMARSDYEPLIDRIRGRLLSWTNRFLSYGGRLQLIKSVIASTTNFWQSVFRLPQKCMDSIESMCSAFLWSGSLNSNKGSKVSWADVCVPKDEGGLGIRNLRETREVFSLHLIWRLFTSSTSLWVKWVQHHLLRESSFWDIRDTGKGSWIWRKLLKLRQLAYSFMTVDVQGGKEAHFWHDNWTGIGKLWDDNIPSLTRQLGIPRQGRVSMAFNASGWSIRRPRGAHLRSIYDIIVHRDTPTNTNTSDVYKWKHDEEQYKNVFFFYTHMESTQEGQTKSALVQHGMVSFSSATSILHYLAGIS